MAAPYHSEKCDGSTGEERRHYRVVLTFVPMLAGLRADLTLPNFKADSSTPIVFKHEKVKKCHKRCLLRQLNAFGRFSAHLSSLRRRPEFAYWAI